MSYNYFGATIANTLLHYASGSYTPTSADFGGDTAVNLRLEQATQQVIAALPPRVFQNLIRPDLLMAVPRTTPGQTQFTLPFAPLIPGHVRIWTGHPSIFLTRPLLRTDPFFSNALAFGAANPNAYPAQSTAAVEKPMSAFSVNDTTGLVTLLDAGLPQDWRVFASYYVDPEQSTYSIPSLGRLIEMGAAWELGSLVYSRATDAWAQVENLGTKYVKILESMNKGETIPDELRLLQWWQPVEKTNERQIGVVRFSRG